MMEWWRVQHDGNGVLSLEEIEDDQVPESELDQLVPSPLFNGETPASYCGLKGNVLAQPNISYFIPTENLSQLCNHTIHTLKVYLWSTFSFWDICSCVRQMKIQHLHIISDTGLGRNLLWFHSITSPFLISLHLTGYVTTTTFDHKLPNLQLFVYNNTAKFNDTLDELSLLVTLVKTTQLPQIILNTCVGLDLQPEWTSFFHDLMRYRKTLWDCKLTNTHPKYYFQFHYSRCWHPKDHTQFTTQGRAALCTATLCLARHLPNDLILSILSFFRFCDQPDYLLLCG